MTLLSYTYEWFNGTILHTQQTVSDRILPLCRRQGPCPRKKSKLGPPLSPIPVVLSRLRATLSQQQQQVKENDNYNDEEDYDENREIEDALGLGHD